MKQRNSFCSLLYLLYIAVIAIVCLWNVNIVESAFISGAGSTSDSYCPYQQLPTNLNDLNYLGFNGEFHIHETFYYNFKNFQSRMDFEIKEKSAFRIYVAPHIVDIDLWLYSVESQKSINHTTDTAGDENLYAELEAGKYYIKFLFFGQNKASKLDCKTISLEIAISPTALMQTRVQGFKTCPTQQTLPNMDFKGLSTSGSYIYDSDVANANLAILDSNIYTEPFKFFGPIPFTLPEGVSNKYGVDISVGFDFLTGGSLNILLISSEDDKDSNVSDLKCYKSSKNCTIGIHSGKGHSIIKTVLLPGDYNIYFYDQTNEKDALIQPDCLPFSFFMDISPAHQLEDFLNCNEYVLPSSFNEPGFIDDGGYMYFDEDVYLDLTAKYVIIPFTLTEPMSYFRTYIADFRVDIDVSLSSVKADGSLTPIVSGFRFVGEEEIYAQIPKGDYQLKISYFGKNVDVFCEAYPLEVTIVPITDYSVVCGETNTIPILNINSAIQSDQSYSLNTDTTKPAPVYQYTYQPTGSITVHSSVITSANFTIPEDGNYYFESILESNFAVSNIRMVLIDDADENQSEIRYVGTHDRNRHLISSRLYPGNYSVVIETPSVNTQQAASLPQCIVFSLSVVIKQIPDGYTNEPSCLGIINQLPTNLNSPAYLGTSQHIHLSGDFIMPSLSIFSSKTTTHNFTVTTASLFRAYTPSTSNIDIDFNLFEDDKLVSWNTKFYKEEPMLYRLKANSNYRFVIKYYHFAFSTVPDCSTIYLELAIGPLDDNPNDVCGAANLQNIPNDLIPTASTKQFYSSSKYNFNQNKTSGSISLPFSVPSNVGMAEFRAFLTYDFLWNNLALQLVSSATGNIITSGSFGYNYHDIELLQLPAGSYELIIYEPFPNTKTDFNLRNCVEYVLDVGLQLVDDVALTKDTVVCPWLMLPATFDSLGYKSQLTSNSLYYQETVLADVFNKKDTVTFTVGVKSLFRAYVPSHPLIDISITLSTASGSVVKSDKTVIFLELKPDKYSLTFYYSGSGGPAPKIEDCPSFDAFISIVPTADFIANSVIVNDCPVNAPAVPKVIQANYNQTATYYRDMSLQPKPYILTFSTSNYSHIYVNVDYNDLVAPLALSLDGSAIVLGSVQQRSYSALYQGGEAFINEVIPEGNWTLTISDSFKSPAPNSNVQCAPFSLSYFLKTDDIVPTCENLAQLPSDLSVGNYPYGGKQSATGEIRLSAPGILIPQSNSPIRVSFINPTTISFMRIYAKTDYKNDITFKIFNSTSVEPIYSSSIKTSIDDRVWKLPRLPSQQYYVLEISTVSSKNDINCNYFSFDLAIDNIDTVEEGLLCKVPALDEADQVPPFEMTFENGKDFSVSSSKHYFTSKRIQQNTDKKGMFTYVMSLEVKGPIFLSTSIGFDFLVNDLNIALYNVTTNKIDIPFTTGTNSIILDDNSKFDIYNSIKTPLSPGSYHLVISEDMTSNSFGIPNYCRYFDFSLSATSTSDGVVPRISDAQPPTQTNMRLFEDLKVTISFSEKFSLPTSSANVAWVTYIKNTDAIYLENKDDNTKVYPSAAIPFNSKTSSLILTFAQKDLKTGIVYQLVMDSSKFVSDNSKIGFAPKAVGTLPKYRFLECHCSGDHGTCDSDGETCKCIGLWAGSDCSKCRAGYHGVGTDCVKNVACSGNTCNGHGKCSDASGFPECSCNTGYSSEQNNLCGICAYGYTGYPQCTFVQDNQPTYCYAPIIPSTLNSIEYLLFENNVHIQDNYYLDINSGAHEIFFTLTQSSMLRVYTEPHEMDVDIWLYNATENGDLVNSIDRSITFNHEEVILSVLSPGHYIIAFKYYNWGRIVDSCPTFNLELAIDTLANIQDIANQGKMCGDGTTSKDRVPGADAMPAIIQNNFAYDQPANTYLLFAKPTDKIVYLWNTTFTIQPTETGKIVMADIEIGYQFLPGDLSLLIQAGDSKTIKCKGSTDTADSGCIYGDNELNRNVIHATLIPGVYTLWIYAPEFSSASNLNCAPFTFKSSFTMINDDEDYFNCEGEILPASLNNPQFLVNNYLHLQDLFLVDSKHSDIKFSLTETCVIRVNGQQDSAIVLLSLLGGGVVLSKDTSVFHMELVKGDYTLHIQTNIIANAANFCPLLNLEIAIEPSDTPIHWKPVCPAVKTTPMIAAKIPFIFENGTKTKEVFYIPTNSPRIVGSYAITLTQTCQFYAAIASEFLRGDLRINLYKVLDDNSNMPFIMGTHDYNYNWIQEDLLPGRYTFNIERPEIKVVGGIVPECIPYEFEFTLLPMSKLPMCPGEPIPLDWNSIRFLGTEGKLHYQSDNFVVPQGKFTQVNIALTVTKKSVIRIYVNPHIVDVDIHLINPYTNQSLASGSNGINTEESFVYLMDAGPYFVNLQFWKWSKAIPDCTTFSMEIAVQELDDIVKTGNCKNGGDFWPTIPSIKDNQYSYNSLDSGKQFYFQQATAGSGLKSTSLPFTTDANTNVHFQVGFDFLTGDLALKLVSNAKNKKVYYGTIAPNRNILEIVNLPAGSYNLVIYEPYSSLDEIMGCSYFNFDFYMEQYVDYNQIDGFYHYLPSTLDSYAYLNYNWATHLQGEYMMFDGIPAHNVVPFTVVLDPVFIRVQATVVADDEVNNYNTTMTPIITIHQIDNTPSGTNIVSKPGSVATMLQPGTYSVIFGPGLRVIKNRAVDVELAIATKDQVQKSINAISYDKNCPNSQTLAINPSPVDGSFYYRETMFASYDKMKQPGVVLEASFTITMPTLIYAQVGYQFLLGDMDLYLVSKDLKTIQLQGRGNRNTNELNVILPTGSYYLSIVNPINIPSDFGAHCTPYSLSLTFRNASNTPHSDCSLFNAIPWDLNSPIGGSAEFGGPMDSAGSLRFYSNDFIAPSTSSTQNMTFKISQPTFVNIFTTDDLVTTIASDVFVSGTNNDQALLYDYPLNGNSQRSALYVAEIGKATNPMSFDIQLTFKGKSRDSCPAFAMQVIMKPISYLVDQLYCPTNYQQILPNASPLVDANGNFNEYIESTISGDFINSKTIGTTNNQFEYYVDFRVTRPSRLESSISFDSIVTNFYLRLANRNFDKNGKVTRSLSGNPGEWTPESSFGETSMTSILNRILQPGNYSLVIIQPKFQPNNYLTASLYGELCFPFTYSFSLMDKNQVSAGTVSPPNGYKLSPSSDLSLSFESYSTFYDSNGQQILCAQTPYIQQSFFLASKTSSDRIAPSSVVCNADDGTKWMFTFDNQSLVPANSYVFSLSPSKLFDSKGVQAVLSPQYVYSMLDTTCSNNGRIVNGVCLCSTGYSGFECKSCAPTFYNIAGHGDAICVSTECSNRYCNCDPNNNATCTQLGKCHVNKGDYAYCVCSKPYNGTTCNTCADGYRNWPYCTIYKECGDCGKGKCNHDNGQCACPSNYQGDSCSECAEGYSGSDCKKNGSGAIIALEVIGSLIVVSIVIGVGIWFIRTRYRTGVTRYKMLPKFEFDNDNERDTQFPGLYDDDEPFDPKNPSSSNKSINSGGKTHVFSFSSMPSSAIDSDDDEDYEQQQKIQTLNQKNNHLFDM